jgi:hypothetical protein
MAALSNYTKAKLIDLINGTSLGGAPNNLFIGFGNAGSEVTPYATRTTIGATYSTVTNEVTFGAVTFPVVATTVAAVDEIRIYDAASGGNLIFSITKDSANAPLSFSFTAGQNRSYNAGDVFVDLRQATDNAIEAIVINRLGAWVTGSTQSSFSGAEVALFNNSTEVTGSLANGRRPVTLNTSTGVNTADLLFGAATGTVTYNTARIFAGSDLLVSQAFLTPTTVTVQDGDSAILPAGQLTLSIL